MTQYTVYFDESGDQQIKVFAGFVAANEQWVRFEHEWRDVLRRLLGGYPSGFDKSNFLFITPMEIDRKKWRSLKGINLFDGQTYQIARH